MPVGRWPQLVTDWHHVVDVPAKLPTRVRLLDTGRSRTTDAHDAHAVAVVVVRSKELRVLSADPEVEGLGMVIDRRDELTRQRIQTVNRLHRPLAELTQQGSLRTSRDESLEPTKLKPHRRPAGNPRREPFEPSIRLFCELGPESGLQFLIRQGQGRPGCGTHRPLAGHVGAPSRFRSR